MADRSIRVPRSMPQPLISLAKLKKKVQNKTSIKKGAIMTNKICTLLFVISFVSVLGCTKKLDTDNKRASYAIGQQIGKNIKQQFADFDPEALAMAIKDASKDKNKMTDKEMQEALTKLQASAVEKQQKEAEANIKVAKEFLEKNKSAPGVKETASGLQYIMEKEGTGKSPKLDDTVKAHYKGTLIDGTVFDSSYDRGQPLELPLKGVIPGWTEALQLMKVGGKAKLFIPPQLAYGNVARPKIPPGSVLIFELELLDIVKPAKK
jgi:FKBP-type peptidyl-prolyl cis-trans isomerase